jgi:radical SAM-linked protein
VSEHPLTGPERPAANAAGAGRPAGIRVRFRFAKVGKVRFTSHRDVARLWERALRRAGLPVASTEGFSPRPKVHFGLALSTGHESLGEYLDVDLREPVDLEPLAGRLTPLLPPGLDVERSADVQRPAPSLQEAVSSCTWRIELSGADPAAVHDGVTALLAAESIPVVRQRKGKAVSDDLRPAITGLAVPGPGAWPTTAGPEPSGVVLDAELATQPRGVRPSELIDALAAFTGRPLSEGRVCRTHQWIVLDGARREPLPASATRAAHATACAS